MSATSIVKELEAELLSLVGERGASKHRMLTLLAEYDLLGGWVAHGAVSCTTWWARKLSWRTEPDGMVTFTLRARPSDAGMLSAAIDAMVMQSTGAPHETLEQQRADALLALVVGERSVSRDDRARPSTTRRIAGLDARRRNANAGITSE